MQTATYLFYNCKMAPGQSYAEWVATSRGIAKDCQFVCKSDSCNHTRFVDEQFRDVIILNTLHAEVQRQSLLDAKTTFTEVLRKTNL